MTGRVAEDDGMAREQISQLPSDDNPLHSKVAKNKRLDVV